MYKENNRRGVTAALKLALTAAVLCLSFSACGGAGEKSPAVFGQSDGDGGRVLRIYFIPKNMGNNYFDAISSGFYDAMAEIGEENFSYTYFGPETAEPDSQLPYVERAVAEKADAIFIAVNSNDALNPAFDAARAAGTRIYIINQDAPGSEAHRDAAIMPVSFETIGKAQIELLAKQLGYEGEFAILSATQDAPDQNAWIESIKAELANDPKYGKMELVDIAYGDDQSKKSADEMQALITKYPNLKGVIAPTAVGLPAACRVLHDLGNGGKIKITGLGLPSEMSEFVKNGVCESFHLWNPPYEGYLGVFMTWAEATGDFVPAPGATFSAGRLGDFTIMPNGQVLTLETPMLYDKSNITKYSVMF